MKDPIHSGTADGGMLSAVKDELSGGMASHSLSFSLSVPLSLSLSHFAGGSERRSEMRRSEARRGGRIGIDCSAGKRREVICFENGSGLSRVSLSARSDQCPDICMTPPRALVVMGVYGDMHDVRSKVIRFLRGGGGKDTICKLTARRVCRKMAARQNQILPRIMWEDSRRPCFRSKEMRTSVPYRCAHIELADD